MKAWLKGGLIYSVIYIITEILTFIVIYLIPFQKQISLLNIIGIFQKIVFFPLILTSFISLQGVLGGGLISIIFHTIFLFAIASIVIWFIQKIKSKKQENGSAI